MKLDGFSLKLPRVAGHPNRIPFVGTLMLVDVPTDGPAVSKTGGVEYRDRGFLMPRAVAEVSLPSLIGAPVNCQMGFKGHAPESVIGMITLASVGDVKLSVAGVLFGANFPRLVHEIAFQDGNLGMSYEVGPAQVVNQRKDLAWWTLSKVVFTGASILWRERAAFKASSFTLVEQDGEVADRRSGLAVAA